MIQTEKNITCSFTGLVKPANVLFSSPLISLFKSKDDSLPKTKRTKKFVHIKHIDYMRY